MEVIKSVEDLPAWFKNAEYKKGLDATDWYREVRKREWVATNIMTSKDNDDMPVGRPLTLFRACYKNLKKNWAEYYQYGVDMPVRDMSKAEAIFLAASNDGAVARIFYKDVKALLKHYRHELSKGKNSADPEYEDHLSYFLDDWHNMSYRGLDAMAYRIPHDDGNPMLNYCRPFEGYPVVIDTSFDDETILSEVKRYLSETRKIDEPKARRPFSTNDFADWSNYRLREIHDLDLWCALTNTKIHDRVMAAALWPNAPDTFSPLDVLRTTARKKVKEVFNEYVSKRLYGQLVLKIGENFLDD